MVKRNTFARANLRTKRQQNRLDQLHAFRAANPEQEVYGRAVDAYVTYGDPKGIPGFNPQPLKKAA